MAEPGDAEDSNLDDFFAKKDKSKKKSKSSKITTDEIEERLEKKLKKVKVGAATKKDRERRDAGGEGKSSILSIASVEDDGDWNEVEENTGKDYSGLRVQNFQLSVKEQEEKDRQDARQGGEDGEDGERREAVQGPWKSIQNQPALAGPPIIPDTAAPTRSDPEPALAAAKSTGKYVPPGARAGAAKGPGGSSAVTSTGGGPKKKKTAPNVNSQEDFPTLASASIESNDGAVQEYEKVRSGGPKMDDPASHVSKLSLGNKYGALDGSENS